MATLMILGSKPEPALPPRASVDAIGCVNASGYTAARVGLPDPTFTVMTAALTSGRQPSHHFALEALRGLRTGALYMIPRPGLQGFSARRLKHELRNLRVRPWYFRWKLRAIGYRFETFASRSRAYCHGVLMHLCGDEPAVSEQVARQRPSTGILAVAIGLADPRFTRLVVGGFSFETTHAYTHDRGMVRKGRIRSRHTDTDVLVLRHLCARHPNLYTTEPHVHECAGVPYL
jgi:hypothetical protein